MSKVLSKNYVNELAIEVISLWETAKYKSIHLICKRLHTSLVSINKYADDEYKIKIEELLKLNSKNNAIHFKDKNRMKKGRN